MFISVDPGKNVGVATFNHEGVDINRTVMQEAEFRNFLKMVFSQVMAQNKAKPESPIGITFIMENYQLRQDKALDQLGSDMPASRIIGAVQMVDELLGDRSEIVLQQPGVLHTALKWAGFEKYANSRIHPPDDIAAYSHGMFHLINVGLRKHPIFDE